jgi:hypothetical protein
MDPMRNECCPSMLILLCVVGCGSTTSDQERRSCDNAIKLCGYSEGKEECLEDLEEAKQAMSSSYGRFLDCSATAKTCGEYVGCAIGGVSNEAIKQLVGMGHGMGKMRDDGSTPIECKRASDLCSGLEAESASRMCGNIMGRVKLDAIQRSNLMNCEAAANSCMAFADCVAQLLVQTH